MKSNGLTLRAALIAAALTSAANVFAGGLFDCSLFKRSADRATGYAVEDNSFFGGQALTIGDCCFGAPNEFVVSEPSMGYAGCLGCQAPVYAPSYAPCNPCEQACAPACNPCEPACAPVCNPCEPACNPCEQACAPVCGSCDFICDPCDFGYGGWGVPVVNAAPRKSANPICGLFSGLKKLLCGRGGGYEYCQPAYVCDPCWSCEPCWEPCGGFCDPCAPVCAPECNPCDSVAPSCCGGGSYPGEVRPLSSSTGLAAEATGGFDAQVTSQPAAQDVIETEEPATPAYPSPAPRAVTPEPENIPTPEPEFRGAGVLKMLVPEDATVYVNGYKTKQSGTVRSFSANDLEYGETYSFEIRVVAVRNGVVYEDVQTATLTAGASSALAFNLTRANEAVALNR
ncbi:MAG: TIGR03000 domain-containing protein [Thermoguttaceae bacterium]|nr:TIGR03000 domain-containing protein [Thermoguttaceae bacterium]